MGLLERENHGNDYNITLQESSDVIESYVAVNSSTQYRLAKMPKVNHHNNEAESIKIAAKYFKENSGFFNNNATWKLPYLVFIVYLKFTLHSS